LTGENAMLKTFTLKHLLNTLQLHVIQNIKYYHNAMKKHAMKKHAMKKKNFPRYLYANYLKVYIIFICLHFLQQNVHIPFENENNYHIMDFC